MKTRRIPIPALPPLPSFSHMAATTVIVIASILIVVSLTITGTFDAGLVMKTPGEHILTLQDEGRMILQTILMQKKSLSSSFATSISTNHPMMTLAVGAPLSYIPPGLAVPMGTALTGLLMMGFLYLLTKHAPDTSAVLPVIAWMLMLQSVYDELRNPAFQLVASIALYIALSAYTHGRKERSALFLSLSWLIQPAWIVLLIPLLIARQWKIAGIAFFTFAVMTLPFSLTTRFVPYLMTLKETFFPPSGAFNIAALPRFLDIPPITYTALAGVVFLTLIVLQLVKKLAPTELMVLWSIGAVLFTGSVIPSTYIVIPILMLFLVLSNHIRITPAMTAAMIGMAIPSPLIWLRIGWNQTIMTTSDTTLAAVWTAYWTVFLFIILSVHILTNGTMERTKSGK